MPIDLESGKFNPPPFLGNEKLEELVQKFPLTQEFIDAIQRDLGGVNSDLENYLPLTGGTLTGAVNFEGDVKVDDLPILSTVYSDSFNASPSSRWYKLNLPELGSGANHYRRFTVYAYTAFGNLNRFKEFEVYIVTRGSGAANGFTVRILETVRGIDINIPFYYKANGNGHDFYINLPNTYSGLRIDDHSNYVGGFVTTRGSWSYSDTGPSSPILLTPQEVFSGYSIENGNNSNGEYWKFPNGLLICTQELVSAQSMTISNLGGFRSGGLVWTYPHAFITPCTPHLSARTSASFIGGAISEGTTSSTYTLSAVTSQGGANRSIALTAIGRWKN